MKGTIVSVDARLPDGKTIESQPPNEHGEWSFDEALPYNTAVRIQVQPPDERPNHPAAPHQFLRYLEHDYNAGYKVWLDEKGRVR